jgi:hypothetical protein
MPGADVQAEAEQPGHQDPARDAVRHHPIIVRRKMHATGKKNCWSTPTPCRKRDHISAIRTCSRATECNPGRKLVSTYGTDELSNRAHAHLGTFSWNRNHLYKSRLSMGGRWNSHIRQRARGIFFGWPLISEDAYPESARSRDRQPDDWHV